MICIQILIFSNKGFKEEYISHIIKFKKIQLQHSLTNTYQFNNNRIQSMNLVIKNREDIENTLTKLESQLEEFNEKYFDNDNKKDNCKTIDLEEHNTTKEAMNIGKALLSLGTSLVKYDALKKKIKDLLLSRTLLSFYIWLYKRTVSLRSIEKKRKNYFWIETIKGNTNIISNS